MLDIIDPAILRPGRLDKLVYVQLPTAEERFDILKRQTKKTPLYTSVDLWLLANHSRCDRFSGADISSLVREASLLAAKEFLTKENSDSCSPMVSHEHFERAFMTIVPSVSIEDRARYDALYHSFRSDGI